MINTSLACTGCETCVSVCPQKCITMKELKNGFLYPAIDTDKCVKCNICNIRCPVNNSIPSNVKENSKFYAAINTSGDIRMESSSGGVFTSLAEYVLKQNGVVFGAVFDSNFRVVHDYVEKKDGLYKIRGSKYVQSYIGDSYIKCKSFLENGRIVFFSGTPCQIAGLKSYLNKEYENLILQDIICHGVPSPGLWKRYLSERNKSNIKKISFRDKQNGWMNSNMNIEYTNDTVISHNNGVDAFVGPFLMNLNTRESCFECKYKGTERLSDITLGDFWGIKDVDSSMFDDKGTSLVITHSEKGEYLLHRVSLLIKEKKKSDAINDSNNVTAIKCMEKPEYYEMYMRDAQSKGIIKIYDYYFNPNLLQKIHRKVRVTLKRKY